MGGMGDVKNLHSVDWGIVYSPLREGGLGVCKFRTFNQALLGVLFVINGESWVGWMMVEARSLYGVSHWKCIWGDWHSCVM